MFEYPLKGKNVILSLDPDFIQFLQPYGITGSPILVKVFRQETEGLWVEVPNFEVCPTGVPKLFSPKGKPFCRAHIFINRKAVLAAVAFPGQTPDFAKAANLHKIGFKAKGKKKKSTGRGAKIRYPN